MAAITTLSYTNTNSAWTETKFVNVTLSSDGNQSFQSLVQQAQTLATNLIEQQFAENSSITNVSVTVVGEHNGQEVPLLFTRVSLSD